MGESDDITIDTIIDEIVKEVPNRKVKGRLNNHRVYLAGQLTMQMMMAWRGGRN